ncbi:MAG: HNH endonuclease [Alphaproteobacteria bacterium]|nr:HNH endonuclease [Alphaproteobacteria bacterium]
MTKARLVHIIMSVMAQRSNCIYCNREITTRSKEHVIQNALGGLYESEDICCPECNNFISKHIDVPFTKIFNPIISRIDDFSKTNNTKSTPPCTGKVVYNGKCYNANIKAGKVVSCPDLSRELRCDISKLPLQIVSYNFDLQNSAFQTGIAKIAFNYAMAQNVDFKYLEPGLIVDKSGNAVNSIKYNYSIIPFCPLNPVDVSLELDGEATEPFHNMILFSQHNELWCYVDLFNTFQYYVLLSDNIPANQKIYANYTQTLQKINRTAPVLHDLYDPKTVMIYARQYGVEPCMDPAEFSRRVNNAVAQKSQKIDMSKIYSARIQRIPVIDYMTRMAQNLEQMYLFYNAMHMYFNNDVFQEKNFRTLTPTLGGGTGFYPHEAYNICSQNLKKLEEYTYAKFNKLNQFLCGFSR